MHLLKPSVLLLLLSAVPHLTSFQEFERRTISENDWNYCRQYLHDYYGLNTSDPASDKNGFLLNQKILEMQRFFHIPLTGTLDVATMEEIEKPRCGFPDVETFTLFGGRPKWPSNSITYRVLNGPAGIRKKQAEQAIARAFRIWSDVTPLRFFKRKSGSANIMIFSATGNHGDGGNNRFDGPSGILAHAFAPGDGIGGDAHFDNAERWSLTANGINFFLVAAHEFGHSLGLGHSRDRRALMFPTYKYVNTQRFKLASDDIRGIQTLYGRRGGRRRGGRGGGRGGRGRGRCRRGGRGRGRCRRGGRRRGRQRCRRGGRRRGRRGCRRRGRRSRIQQGIRKERKQRDVQQLGEFNSFQRSTLNYCDPNMSFDAAFNLHGYPLLFKNGIGLSKDPHSENVKQFPAYTFIPNIHSIDAAVNVPDEDAVIVFKGSEYWKFKWFQLLPDFPQGISMLGFPTSVTQIDAALYTKLEKKALFFVGDHYWSYDVVKNHMDKDNPRPIQDNFPGIGNKVDAAFDFEGFYYFSNGATLYKYDPTNKQVNSTSKANSWFNCK